MKKKNIILIITFLILSISVSIILNNIKGDTEKIYFNIIAPLLSGIVLIWIFLSKKIKETDPSYGNKVFKFINKYQYLFLGIGLLSIITFVINIVLILGHTNQGNNVWTEELINKEIEYTYKSSKSARIKFPKETYKYCECVINKLKDSISYQEYIDSAKAPTPNAIKKYGPIYQECLKTYKKETTGK